MIRFGVANSPFPWGYFPVQVWLSLRYLHTKDAKDQVYQKSSKFTTCYKFKIWHAIIVNFPQNYLSNV